MTEHLSAGRRVVANIGLSMDGYYRRAGDEGIVHLADAEVGYDQIVRTIETATTAVLASVPFDADTGQAKLRGEF